MVKRSRGTVGITTVYHWSVFVFVISTLHSEWISGDFPNVFTFDLISVADPGFPRRGGAPTPEFGPKTYYLTIFLSKTAWKWKKIGPGGAPSAPLDLPMDTYPLDCIVSWHEWLFVWVIVWLNILSYISLGEFYRIRTAKYRTKRPIEYLISHV